jgi:hypothetical protein
VPEAFRIGFQEVEFASALVDEIQAPVATPLAAASHLLCRPLD